MTPKLKPKPVAMRTDHSAVLARIEGMDVRKLAASTQYGMGLVIVIEGAKHLMSGIVYRNDSMSHAERVQLADDVNQILRHNVSRLVMPSSLRIPLIEVFHQAGDPPFICGVNGHVTTDMLDEIEADIDENAEDMLREGDGTYLFKATRFSGQYGEEGRCEIAPCWELEMVLFSQYNAKGVATGSK